MGKLGCENVEKNLTHEVGGFEKEKIVCESSQCRISPDLCDPGGWDGMRSP